MTDSIRVVLVTGDTGRGERDADRLSGRAGLKVATAAPDTLEEGVADADCLVTDDPDLDVPTDGPPVVLYADVPPTGASESDVEGFVRRTGDDVGHLADQVRFVVERSRSPAGSPASLGGKIHELHEGTADIVASRSMGELYERTVEVAEEILAFDVSYLLVRDGDQFVPRASSSVSTDTP